MPARERYDRRKEADHQEGRLLAMERRNCLGKGHTIACLGEGGRRIKRNHTHRGRRGQKPAGKPVNTKIKMQDLHGKKTKNF